MLLLHEQRLGVSLDDTLENLDPSVFRRSRSS